MLERRLVDLIELHFLQIDEHPRPSTTMESLAKLKPVFQKDGLINAGNASVGITHIPRTTCLSIIKRRVKGISDGAATMVVAGEEAIGAHSLKPLVRVVSYAAVGKFFSLNIE